ncbi:MAG: EAL domain-containing protein [Saccharofermentans sp.]|nr:EAL domain-containing protein [Saccharofermentans sp.]
MTFHSDILELMQIFNNPDMDLHSNPSFTKLTDVLCINRVSYQVIGDNLPESNRILFTNKATEIGQNYDFSVKTYSGNTVIIRIYRYQYAAPLGEYEDLFTIFANIVLNKIAAMENKKESDSILYYDQRMNLHNTNYLYRQLSTFIKNDKISEYAIMFLNVKETRNLNALFGIETTNMIIKDYANTTLSLLDQNEGEDIYSLGGDNYIVLLKKENENDIIKYMSNANIRLETNNDIIEYTLSAHIGVLRLTDDFTSINEIMDSVYSAYTLSKSDENPDIFFFDNSIKRGTLEEEDFADDIKDALEKEKFLVYFQPIVSKNNDDINLFSAEALLRWRRQGEMINPRDFLKIADKYKLMRKIDLYVLKTVCTKLSLWIKEGLNPVCIHCNFADSDLLTLNLADEILQIIDEYEIHHSLINIEFAESAYHKNKNAFIYTINKLHNAGVKVSIDNFGRNFTSLELFEEFDFTTLKIDSSIVNSDNSKTKILLTNLISLADNLGIEVICQGADTKSEIKRAFEAGCDIFQSEVYDKALSERYFTNRLKNPKY